MAFIDERINENIFEKNNISCVRKEEMYISFDTSIQYEVQNVGGKIIVSFREAILLSCLFR